MTFGNRKKQALKKLKSGDKSKKGSVDAAIKQLVDLINTKDDYFTTSSCAGRISLTQFSKSRKKNETKWFFVTHDPVKTTQITNLLSDLPEEQVWFKLEPSILHICCKDFKSAESLIKLAKQAGYKRAHIASLKNTIVEILDSQRIEAPFSEKKKLLIDKEYIKILVTIANTRLKKTREKVNKLFTLIK